MPKIRDMHRKILGTIGEFHARTTRSVEEHERDLSRQFRTKMIEIEEKMAKEQHQVAPRPFNPRPLFLARSHLDGNL